MLQGGKEGYVRWLSVQPDSHSLEFRLQQRPLFGALGGIEHHENQVARLCCRDDLPPSAFAFGRTLDDPWQIEQLDLGATILEDTGDSCEGGEGIRGYLGLGFRDFGEEC